MLTAKKKRRNHFLSCQNSYANRDEQSFWPWSTDLYFLSQNTQGKTTLLKLLLKTPRNDQRTWSRKQGGNNDNTLTTSRHANRAARRCAVPLHRSQTRGDDTLSLFSHVTERRTMHPGRTGEEWSASTHTVWPGGGDLQPHVMRSLLGGALQTFQLRPEGDLLTHMFK